MLLIFLIELSALKRKEFMSINKFSFCNINAFDHQDTIYICVWVTTQNLESLTTHGILKEDTFELINKIIKRWMEWMKLSLERKDNQ